MRSLIFALFLGFLCACAIGVSAQDASLEGITGKTAPSSEPSEEPRGSIKIDHKAQNEFKAESVPLPNVSPFKVTGTVIGLVWLSIFTMGMCALCGVQTPLKFEEKGLMMSKEY